MLHITRVLARSFGLVLLVSTSGCDSPSQSAPAKADPSTRGAEENERGTAEMKKVREDVKKAHEAGLERNDRALDGATKSEGAPRGAPTR